MNEKAAKRCPKCNGELLEGFLPGAPHWKLGRSMFGKTSRIFGYKCRNCGYVEFYVEEIKARKETEL